MLWHNYSQLLDNMGVGGTDLQNLTTTLEGLKKQADAKHANWQGCVV